jgi:hypothetical protein
VGPAAFTRRLTASVGSRMRQLSQIFTASTRSPYRPILIKLKGHCASSASTCLPCHGCT